jgi:tetratricopeptide (TPR) repeat protein
MIRSLFSVFILVLPLASVGQGLPEYKGLESTVHVEAASYLEKYWKAELARVDPDSPATVFTLRQLADVYHTQGRYAEAAELLERALVIVEKTNSPEAPLVAEVLNQLAVVYHVQGQDAKAEPLQKRALAIREKAFYPKHPEVVESLNNLADIYRTTRRYAEAESLYKRVLEIREDYQSLNNLAGVYYAQRRFAKAEPLLKRALASVEKSVKKGLSAEDPVVATIRDNIAALYRAQGRDAEAEPLYKQALAIREKEGQELEATPFRARELNEQAKSSAFRGNFAAAVWALEKALAIMEKTLGPKHPETVTARNDLAALYRAEGREQEAQRLVGTRVAQDTSWQIDTGIGRRAYQQGDYVEAEKRYKAVLAKTDEKADHIRAATLNALGSVYQAQGRYAEAEPLHKRALAISEKESGPEGLGVGVSLNHLGQLYGAQGRYAKAEPLFKRALAILEKQRQGPELLRPAVDLQRAQILSNLAGLYVAQGRYAEAEPLYELALALAENILKLVPGGTSLDNVAEQHRIQALNNLAELYRAQGQDEKAERLLRKHGK